MRERGREREPGQRKGKTLCDGLRNKMRLRKVEGASIEVGRADFTVMMQEQEKKAAELSSLL